MKFRNPKTGEIFNVSFSVAWTGFCYGINCSDCPIRMGPPYCKKFVHDHPHEAARLMGYEVVEDDHIPKVEKKEANMDKPRICEILGVVPGEEFFIKDFYPGHVTFRIMDDGTFSTRPSNISGSSLELLRTLDHPDRIIRKPRFTEQEVERAKAIRLIYPTAYRLEEADPLIRVWDKEGKLLSHVDTALFFSLRPGQCYTLDEIIGGAE